MSGIARGFMAAAVIYGLLGMVLGLVMAASQDHSQMPTHAHVMVIGWVSFALFGLIYHQFPQLGPSLWARLHFWTAQASFPCLVVALFLLYAGKPQFEPLAVLGSVAYLVSFVCFAVAAVPVLRRG